MNRGRLKVGVFKFASCDGCQLVFLNAEEDLLPLARRVEFAYFPEARSRMKPGPYDVAFVEGSVSTPEHAERILKIRASSRLLVCMGACATAGGIQALRNWSRAAEYAGRVYPRPEYIETLATATPISQHVRVDLELHGCPIDREQLFEVLTQLLQGASVQLPSHSLCLECKRRGTVCGLVARGIPCMGPATRTGCSALCPAYARDCYACFGPSDDPNPEALARCFEDLGLSREELVRRFRSFTGWSPAFRKVSDAYEAAPEE